MSGIGRFKVHDGLMQAHTLRRVLKALEITSWVGRKIAMNVWEITAESPLFRELREEDREAPMYHCFVDRRPGGDECGVAVELDEKRYNS